MDRVTVLLATYNGEKYLAEQIESVLRQKHVEVQLLVRDDGSKDRTEHILETYQKNGKLKWYRGVNLKPAGSFMNLVGRAGDSDFYAFCDQDDVWKEEKLERAVSKLKKMPDGPKLYASNYQLTDKYLNPLPDNGHRTTTTLNEALVCSCATGCTLVFNRELMRILQLHDPKQILMHDDWVHKVCLAVGGKVCFDGKYRSVYYRQHGENVDGGVRRISRRVSRIWFRIRTKECIRSRQWQEILTVYRDRIPEENQMKIRLVADYRKSICSRVRILANTDIRTQNFSRNLGFWMAILFGYF